MSAAGEDQKWPFDGECSSVRFLLEADGRLYRIARLAWSRRDVSLYLIPSEVNGGVSYVGVLDDLAPGESAVDYGRQGRGAHPYMSIHQSGRTHAQVDGMVTRPVAGPPLFAGDGGHIASIDCFNVAGLPVHDGPIKRGRRHDVVLRPERQELHRVHVGLHTRRAMPDLDGVFQLVLTMDNPGMLHPLHFAFAISGEPAPSDSGAGVLVTGGWGLDARHDSPVSMVYAVTSAALPPGSALHLP